MLNTSVVEVASTYRAISKIISSGRKYGLCCVNLEGECLFFVENKRLASFNMMEVEEQVGLLNMCTLALAGCPRRTCIPQNILPRFRLGLVDS